MGSRRLGTPPSDSYLASLQSFQCQQQHYASSTRGEVGVWMNQRPRFNFVSYSQCKLISFELLFYRIALQLPAMSEVVMTVFVRDRKYFHCTSNLLKQ